MENQEIIDNCRNYTFFAWSKQSGLSPLNIKRTKGCYLYDYNGKTYIDFSSQLMNVNIGHSHPQVLEAIIQQSQKACYLYPGFASEPRGLLGKKIAEITPKNLVKSFFTLGGADAIENAIKIARWYSGKDKIITRYRSYHGATMGAISAGGDPRKHAVDANAIMNVLNIWNESFYSKIQRE
jgi:taurine--2-oxoglutarate transaminase